MIDSTTITEIAQTYPGIGAGIALVAVAARIGVGTVKAMLPLIETIRKSGGGTTTNSNARHDQWRCAAHEGIASTLAEIKQKLTDMHDDIKSINDRIQRETDEIYPRLREVEMTVAVLEAGRVPTPVSTRTSSTR